jgi:UDP-hydrolysing UDP-N-acetyl-D-glucosamine 2-epimerase
VTTHSAGRRIAVDVVTGSRADYSLILPIARALAKHPALDARLVFSGAHYGDNEKAGLAELMSTCAVPALGIPADGIGRSDQACSAAMGAMTQGFGRLWAEERPRACVLLGDRFELLPPASVAVIYNMAIVHVFGGEEDVSYCFDSLVRDALTKMAHVHLVMHEAQRERLLRMGEQSWRITVIGNPSLENRQRDGGAAFRAAARANGWGPGPYIAACYLPATAFPGLWTQELDALLTALSDWPHHTVIWAGVNADPESRLIEAHLRSHCAVHRNHFFASNLGSTLFPSLLQAADVLVGNSSSGLIEAPTYGLPSITVGVRQTGRLTGPQAIIVPAETEAIRNALATAINDQDFRRQVANARNPYHRPGGADAGAEFVYAMLRLDRSKLFNKRHLSDNPVEWLGLRRVPEYLPATAGANESTGAGTG